MAEKWLAPTTDLQPWVRLMGAKRNLNRSLQLYASIDAEHDLAWTRYRLAYQTLRMSPWVPPLQLEISEATLSLDPPTPVALPAQ